jgi:hypothetical protein
MFRGLGRPTPAMVVALLALFVALGGSVYAASGIDGRTIKPKSLPGNRLMPGSLAANRLAPGTIPGSRLAPGSVTGAQIDAATLEQVPSAARANQADSARDASRAQFAQSAGDAASLNGHVAACAAGTRPFAGACWQATFTETAASAAEAAVECAKQGGELPAAFALAAFAKQPGVAIASEGEWTGELGTVGGPDSYSVVIINGAGEIDDPPIGGPRKYRCVFPLLR